MKTLISILFLGFLPISASADDALRGKLSGIWWGTMKITRGIQMGWNRHWVIERTNDGRYRMQEFWVDPILQVYCVSSSPEREKGTWRLSGKNLLTHQLDQGSTGTDSISVEGGVIKWKGNSMSGPGAEWDCEEINIPKFEPQLEATFRRLTPAEFRDRYKNQGEQDGTGQPATRPESKSEGGQKPQPEAEGRSR